MSLNTQVRTRRPGAFKSPAFFPILSTPYSDFPSFPFSPIRGAWDGLLRPTQVRLLTPTPSHQPSTARSLTSPSSDPFLNPDPFPMSQGSVLWWAHSQLRFKVPVPRRLSLFEVFQAIHSRKSSFQEQLGQLLGSSPFQPVTQHLVLVETAQVVGISTHAWETLSSHRYDVSGGFWEPRFSVVVGLIVFFLLLFCCCCCCPFELKSQKKRYTRQNHQTCALKKPTLAYPPSPNRTFLLPLDWSLKIGVGASGVKRDMISLLALAVFHSQKFFNRSAFREPLSLNSWPSRHHPKLILAGLNKKGGGAGARWEAEYSSPGQAVSWNGIPSKRKGQTERARNHQHW